MISPLTGKRFLAVVITLPKGHLSIRPSTTPTHSRNLQNRKNTEQSSLIKKRYYLTHVSFSFLVIVVQMVLHNNNNNGSSMNFCANLNKYYKERNISSIHTCSNPSFFCVLWTFHCCVSQNLVRSVIAIKKDQL